MMEGNLRAPYWTPQRNYIKNKNIVKIKLNFESLVVPRLTLVRF